MKVVALFGDCYMGVLLACNSAAAQISLALMLLGYELDRSNVAVTYTSKDGEGIEGSDSKISSCVQ